MTTDERVRLSFTGPDSHVLVRRPGVGILTVGPASGRRKADLVVAPDDPVDWTALHDQRLPDGSLWPRYISYEGADTTLFDWSISRPVEDATFTAVRDTVIDARSAQIQRLSIHTQGHRVTVYLPSAATCQLLTLAGDLAHLELHGHPDGTVPSLGIVLTDGSPATAQHPAGSLGLPPLAAFAGVTELTLSADPLGTPFDCRTLRHLPHVSSLTLSGALAHLDALADLPLTSLAVRFCPDMVGLPPLTTWPGLTSVIAWNVDDQVGKRLRAEIRSLGDGHFSGFVSVSQLRSRRWFVEEYGLPFAAWPRPTAKAATTAFKAASRTIAKATDEATVRAAIVTFVERIGELPSIETTEREDAGDAVHLLASISPVRVVAETAQAWFDEVRIF